MLQQRLCKRLKRPVYLCGSEPEEISKVLSAGVCRADALLLLQTKATSGRRPDSFAG